MRTPLQQETARLNGAKSNGPTTPEGKEKSARNRLSHGLYSEAILLRDENRAAWARLQDGLVTRFQPADEVEYDLIHKMAVSSWRADRAAEMEAALINLEYDAMTRDEGPPPTREREIERAALAFARSVGRDEAILELSKQNMRFGRHWMRLHSKLKEVQKDRKAAEALLGATVPAEAIPATPPPPPPPAPEAHQPTPPDPPAEIREFEPGVVQLPLRVNSPAPRPTPAEPLAPTGTDGSGPRGA